MIFHRFIILFSTIILISVLLSCTVLGQDLKNEGEEDETDPILANLFWSGIFLLFTAFMLIFVKKRSSNRSLKRKFWMMLCVLMCFLLPVSFFWSSIFTDGEGALCFVLYIGAFGSVAGFIGIFDKAYRGSVAYIKDFPDEFRVVIPKKWKTIIAFVILGMGAATLIYGCYFVYAEAKNWSDSLYPGLYFVAGGIGTLAGGVIIWFRWVRRNEITVGPKEMKIISGNRSYSVPWDLVHKIKFDTHWWGRAHHNRIRIYHISGKLDVSGADITNPNEFEMFFFAIIYNHTRSDSNASLQYEADWGRKWANGYAPQIDRLLENENY